MVYVFIHLTAQKGPEVGQGALSGRLNLHYSLPAPQPWESTINQTTLCTVPTDRVLWLYDNLFLTKTIQMLIPQRKRGKDKLTDGV